MTTPAHTTRRIARPAFPVPQPEPLSREDLEKLERQIIPMINSIRAALGKPPIIVPKG